MKRFGMRGGQRRRKGFTMTEMLVTVGIIAVLTAIAIPSIISIKRSLEFKKLNNYAEDIFLAAQSNLVDLKLSGGLTAIQTASSDHSVPRENNASFPDDDWSSEYCYATSADSALMAMLLPAGTIDSTLTQHQIMIEYNPYSGNVYAVFYSEGDEALSYNNVTRDESARKTMKLGYYSGSGLSTDSAELSASKPSIKLLNGEEAIVQVRVPVPDEYITNPAEFADSLTITLTVKGEQFGGEFTVQDSAFVKSGSINYTIDSGNAVVKEFRLDSLYDQASFASLAENNTAEIKRSVTSITNEDTFYIKPGENVTITAKIESSAGDLQYDEVSISGVNPMFESLQKVSDSGTRQYDLYITNGRQLQNLNAISETIGAMIQNIYISDDIYWSDTVTYYNNKYDGKSGDTDGANGTYTNTTDSPARGLPYFVPISSPSLFTIASFTTADLPAMTDKSDGADRSAIVYGGGSKIYYLNIDANVTNIGKAYYAGSAEYGNDRFTGLFSYVDTTISDLFVVNSTIKGINEQTFSGNGTTYTGQSAVGSLIGACGHGTFLYNCGAYIDTKAEGYSKNGDYSVTGCGAVGGLVGYAKSHSTTDGELDNDSAKLALSQCFAAVPVTGIMRSDNYKQYGYTNGVGGLVGVSNLTNFYNCYASGNVTVTSGVTVNEESPMAYSRGAGGFVGTSHGTKYANCFATGNVISTGSVTLKKESGTDRRTGEKTYTDSTLKNSTNGSGGFVGIVCYGEGFDYSTTRIMQVTQFNSCYCVGVVKAGSSDTGSGKFSGAYHTGYDIKKLTTTPGRTNYYDTKKYGASDTYLYKDCYYLNLVSDNSDSEQCAKVLDYGDFINLTAYQSTQINNNAMYVSGFLEDDWESATTVTTHPYATSNTAYPFSKLTGMDYYGDWQGFTPGAGLAYFETYTSDSKNSDYAYYFYEDDVTKIDSSTSYTMAKETDVYGDGYALLIKNDSQSNNWISGVKVYINDNSVPLNLDDYFDYYSTSGTYYKKTTYYTAEVSGVKYYVFRMKPELIKLLTSSDSNIVDGFYTKLTVKANINNNSLTFTMYFNPQFAMTQVNPVVVKSTVYNNAIEPISLPNPISIRSVRQLYALSTTSKYWGEGYNFRQELNLEWSDNAYLWSKFTTLDSTPAFTTIGTEATPFRGIYSGSGGYVDNAKLTNVLTKLNDSTGTYYGLFGVIGETGIVQNLTIADSYISLPSNATVAGIVAAENRGTISNVTLSGISNNTTISANKLKVFGLVAGENSGKITGCTVTGSALVNASKAVGGLVGVNTGTVTGNTMNLESLAVTGGTEYVGGVFGRMEGGTFSVTDNALTVNNVSGSNTVGGFAGYLGTPTTETADSTDSAEATDTSATSAQAAPAIEINSLNLTVSGNVISTGGVAAGFAGEVKGVNVTNLLVTLDGNVQGSSGASGVFGNYSALSTNNIQATLNGTVEATGTEANAAGMFLTYGNDTSTFSQCIVTLSGGTIQAKEGSAAGLMTEIDQYFSKCWVILDNGKINGKSAAGFCNTFGTIDDTYTSTVLKDCYVSGTGTINGTEYAAGFVNKAYNAVESCYVYSEGSLGGLTITSDTGSAAGFVGEVNEGASVLYSYVTGTVYGGEKAAGFVGTNDERVASSMANVSVSGGTSAGFVGENHENSKVIGCYVWYSGSPGNSFVQSNNGTVTSCYAAKLKGEDAAFGPSDSTGYSACYNVTDKDSVQDSGVSGIVNLRYEAMAQLSLRRGLSSVSGAKEYWQTAGSNEVQAYTTEGSYPYPSLVNVKQYGDWVTASTYAYGVVYYEVYTDETYGYDINNLSNHKLSYSNTLDTTGKVVKEYGYAVFCNTAYSFDDVTLDGTNVDLSDMEKLTTPSGFADGYTFWIVSKDGNGDSLKVTPRDGDTVTIDPRFADGVTDHNGTLLIRTRSQFEKIGSNSSREYTVEGVLDMSGYETISTFSGTLNLTDAELTNLDCPLFDTLKGTISGGTISGVEGNTIKISGGESIGLLANKAEKATIENVTLKDLSLSASGTTEAQQNIGLLVGTATETEFSDITVDESCTLSYTGYTGTDKEDDQPGTVTITLGGLVGSMTGGKIENCTVGKYGDSIETDDAVRIIGPYTDEKENYEAEDAGCVVPDGTVFYVGGVVGRENHDENVEHATYKDNTTVAVSITNFDKRMDKNTYVLGQFIGYVYDGEFTDCTVRNAKSDVPFLGVVYTETGESVKNAYVTDTEGSKDKIPVGTVSEVSYKAKFENCTRITKVDNEVKEYTLKIKTVYVYEKSDDETDDVFDLKFETKILTGLTDDDNDLLRHWDAANSEESMSKDDPDELDGDALASTELEQEEEEPEQTEATEPTEPAETEQPEETTTPTEQPEATAPTETAEPEETTAPAETEQPEATAASEPVEAEEIMAADVEAE